jgi:hypothetical protein
MQYLVIIMEGSKTLFCSSKFLWARRRICPKFLDNLCTHCPKDLPALPYCDSILITTWLWLTSKLPFQKLTVSQPVNKFPAFYRTQRFITVFTTARHLSLTWARYIQYTPSQPSLVQSASPNNRRINPTAASYNYNILVNTPLHFDAPKCHSLKYAGNATYRPF